MSSAAPASSDAKPVQTPSVAAMPASSAAASTQSPSSSSRAASIQIAPVVTAPADFVVASLVGINPEQKVHLSAEEEELFIRLCGSFTSAVSDGGHAEMKGLFLAQKRLLKNLKDITRDRPHRWRSVMKGFWSSVDKPFREMLAALVTGDHSLAKMMGTSKRYKECFKRAQEQRREPHKSNQTQDSQTPGPPDTQFSSLLQDLNYAEQRFNSRSEPLFRLFMLLPVAIDAVRILACKAHRDGKVTEELWCNSFLEQFAGDAGYCKVVGAALVADVN